MTPEEPPLRGQHFVIQEFIEAVKTGRRPNTDVGDNIKSVSMVFATVKAMETGRTVRVFQGS